MNATHEPSTKHRRHRLLEGVLLRLTRLPAAHDFVLRGGMLMRHWFRPLARTANDLDLVSTFPFNVEETARRFVPLLSDRGVDDGVSIDDERYRVEGIWLNTAFPGVRIFGAGEVDGVEDEFSVDITFGEPLVPAPITCEMPVSMSGLAARLRVCRPETITGRKLHALFHMGMLHWRAKDLNDLRLLLGRVPMEESELPAAIAASFASRGDRMDDARLLFRRDWWTMKTTSARWQEFARGNSGTQVPLNLAGVVAEIRDRLNPILERLP